MILPDFYSIEDLKELENLGWRRSYGDRFNLGSKLPSHLEYFYKKQIADSEAMLYFCRNVSGCVVELSFLRKGELVKKWTRREEDESELVRSLLTFCSSVIEDYFDGRKVPCIQDNGVNLITVLPKDQKWKTNNALI